MAAARLLGERGGGGLYVAVKGRHARLALPEQRAAQRQGCGALRGLERAAAAEEGGGAEEAAAPGVGEPRPVEPRSAPRQRAHLPRVGVGRQVTGVHAAAVASLAALRGPGEVQRQVKGFAGVVQVRFGVQWFFERSTRPAAVCG